MDEPSTQGDFAPTKADAYGIARVLLAEAAIRASLAPLDRARATALCRERYQGDVGRYCMAVLGDLQAVRQSILDIWESISREIERAEHEPTVRAFVLGRARRHCARLLETAELGREDESSEGQSRDHEPTTTERREPLAHVARQLLARLLPSEREMLVLRYVNDLSYGEIGSLWDTSEEEARVRVSRALAHATLLSKRPETSHV